MIFGMQRITLILGLSWFIIVIALLSYAIFPTTRTTTESWAVDDRKYDKAFVTLATTDNSVLGVLVLAYTLREVHSSYPLIVLVSNKISESNLAVTIFW
jgi:hypothetical protein